MAGVAGGSVAGNRWTEIKRVLALSESTKIMPTDTAFNATGYDDNGGLVTVEGTEIKLTKNSSWWSTDWKFKKQITVKNLGSSSVATNMTAQVAADLATLGLGTTKLQSDLDDLRVIYSVGNTHTEVSRTVSQAVGQTNVATISFPLQAGIGVTESDANYYLYYGNVGASTPGNSAGYNIGSATATFVAPFLGSTGAVVAGGTANPTAATGAIRFSGQKSALSFESDDNVSIANISEMTTGSGTFTAECWYKPMRSPDGVVIGKTGFNNGISISGGNVSCSMWNTDNASFSVSAAISNNSWHHIACQFDSSNNRVSLYLDGVYKGEAFLTGSVRNNGTTLYINRQRMSTTGVTGVTDEVRLSTVVRYSSDFTPPLTSFVTDTYTKILLHFDENGDDPRNSGKAIDASGNGNHGTISGAKYVGGLVGVDSSSSDSGYLSVQPYAGHGGIMLEEGTTNFVPNPSFEHSTYNTGWSLPYFNFGTGTTTFMAAMAKRNSAGPFAAGVMVQTDLGATKAGDVLTFNVGTSISDTNKFYSNFDYAQGSIVFWVTPEWNGNDGYQHTLFDSGVQHGIMIYKDSDSQLKLWSGSGVKVATSVSTWTAGNTYLVTARWNRNNSLDGTNYASISVGDTHVFGTGSSFVPNNSTTLYVGSQSDDATKAASAIIEGLTIYRRPLWDGQYGINVGNGDEINLIYNNGTGQDPTLVTGSWDVVFALPTNASVGGIGTTGQAWSHPHASNALYVGTTNTGGFMMGSSYTADGWGLLGGGGSIAYDAGVGASAVGVNNMSFSHTIGSGSSQVLVVAVSYQHSLSRSVSAVYWNGSSLTKLTTASGTQTYSDLWYLQNPAQGTYEVGITMSGTTTGIVAGAVSFSNVLEIGETATNTGTGSTATVGVGASSTDVVVANVGYNSNRTITVGAGQTQVYGIGTSTSGSLSIQSGGVGATTTATFIDGPAVWAAAAVALRPASSGSATVSNQATGEKIFAGGFKAVSSGANQGIGYSLAGLTAGQNYVVRALANSDGTSIPKIQIWDKTNNAEITQMTGTVGSGRTAPDTFVFTFELPTTARYGSAADCTSIEIRLLNTQASGTVYWHQVEMLANLVDNPSMEIGVGATWTPSGWSISMPSGGASEQNVVTYHSGSSSHYFAPISVAGNWPSVASNSISITTGKFYTRGVWYSEVSGSPTYWDGVYNRLGFQTSSSISEATQYLSGNGWKRAVLRSGATSTINENVRKNSSFSVYLDDYYFFQLSDVSLTVTPVTQANSVETSGLRVDGLDTLTQPITGWLTTAGTAKFIFTPRHNFDIGASFGSTAPVIVTLDGGNEQHGKTLQKRNDFKLAGNI